MNKLIFKTALITLGIALILAVSAFGIISFCAPAVMMELFDSVGLENISGDYAYQQYQISKEISYLARSFEIAAAHEKNSLALERFTEFYGEDGSEQRASFAEYCKEQNEVELPKGVPEYDYRSYVCARAAVIKYRLALTEEEKEEVVTFALSETDDELSAECPVVALSVETAQKADGDFCIRLLLSILSERRLNGENEYYQNIVKILEDASNE